MHPLNGGLSSAKPPHRRGVPYELDVYTGKHIAQRKSPHRRGVPYEL